MKINAKKTILLVEDEVIIALATSKKIEKFGYNIIMAYSGEEAVKICYSNKNINLVLMDINLGQGIDGTTAARQILLSRNIPIVFLTSHSEKEYVDKVKDIPRYGYILKNTNAFILQSSIEMAFDLFERSQN